jgi:hypothetical protein
MVFILSIGYSSLLQVTNKITVSTFIESTRSSWSHGGLAGPGATEEPTGDAHGDLEDLLQAV